MSWRDRLTPFVRNHYETHEWRHASAILTQDYPEEWADLMAVLEAFRLHLSWIEVGGGNKSKVSGFIDGFLSARGWRERQFRTAVQIDDTRLESPTHKVDCFRNGVGIEIEWSNKDPFYYQVSTNSACCSSFAPCRSGSSSRERTSLSRYSAIWAEAHPMASRPRI